MCICEKKSDFIQHVKLGSIKLKWLAKPLCRSVLTGFLSILFAQLFKTNQTFPVSFSLIVLTTSIGNYCIYSHLLSMSRSFSIYPSLWFQCWSFVLVLLVLNQSLSETLTGEPLLTQWRLYGSLRPC